ncbi:MAG TPA: hypothetical protein VN238_00750 [Solirubrobacteraceae bacterium]|nr:hypothetical protein [Solirubrobacteraceae bacterium]
MARARIGILLAVAATLVLGDLVVSGSDEGEGRTPTQIGNPWLTRFADSARAPRVRRDSGKLVADLVAQRRFGMGVEQAMWTSPLYVVRSDQGLPRRRIYLRGRSARRADPRKGARHSGEVLGFLLHRGVNGRGWPLPDDAQPDPSTGLGADGHLAILVADTGQYVELNNARRQADGSWTADWGGYVHDIRKDPGHFRDRFVRSLEWSHHGWGATGSSLPLYGGLIREHEIRAAVAAYERGDFDHALIPHALGLNTHGHTQYSWVWPAQRTDCYGRGGCAFTESPIEMGQLFRFPPSFDPRTVAGPGPRETMLLQIVARTIREYGAIVWDASGGGFKLRAELTPGRPMFDYGDAARWLQALPLDRLEVVETRGRRGYRPVVPRAHARATTERLLR